MSGRLASLGALAYHRRVDAEPFDERAFYQAVAGSGARALLIGRRALIMRGLPVMTSDYDLWMPSADIERLNAAVAPLELFPSRSPEEARQRGRYVLENGSKVDVLIASAHPTVTGRRVVFDEVWARREELERAPGVRVAVPCLDDLIATKEFGARPKDAEDLRLLRRLKERGGG
jgi:hypothetical protein